MSILSKPIRILILFIAILFILAGIMIAFVEKTSTEIDIELDREKLLAQEKAYIEQRTDRDNIPLEEANRVDPFGAPTFSYTIHKGETVGQAFNNINMYSQLVHFMEADASDENGLLLVLDKVQPGNELTFWVDQKTNKIQKMNLQFSIDNWAEFILQDDGTYSAKEVTVEGEWKEYVRIGEIHGSLSVSAAKEGISSTEVANMQELLKEKFNFRHLRAGDRFEIVQEKQLVNGVETGKRRIKAVKIYNANRLVSLYKFGDQYYDIDGRSLQRAFLRWPVSSKYRVTSLVNRNRRHPVTGRVTPHNGTDIGTPVGVPVQAAGDGEVIVARNHPIAGKYVAIKHDDTYVTRYLHLSQISVRKGQKVSVGDIIGKTGATGRITGPHLHYEFLVRGVPKDFRNVDMPTALGLQGSELTKFKAMVKDIDQKFADEIARRESPAQDEASSSDDNNNSDTQRTISADEGEWQQDALSGEIHGSFSLSADKQGIYRAEIHKISELLVAQLDFIRDLRAGDKFEVLQTKQIYQNEETGRRDVLAVRIYNRGKIFGAYKFNGFYYDQNGDVLAYNIDAPILDDAKREQFFDYVMQVDEQFAQPEEGE